MLSSLKPVKVLISNASRMSSCKRERVQQGTEVRGEKSNHHSAQVENSKVPKGTVYS
jgi:hypothetical protein